MSSNAMKDAPTTPQNRSTYEHGSTSTRDASKRPECPPKATQTLKRKRMQTRSICWDQFVKYVDKDGSKRARCKYCPNKTYSISSGTSNMLKHSNMCPNNPDHPPSQSLLNIQNNSINRHEDMLSCWRYDQDAIRMGLARMLVIDELSFRFVEKEGFRSFMSLACPKFQFSSRITIARDIYQLYLDERKKLQQCFTNSGQRVSLTTDTWTSLQRVNYMCLTAHFIDRDWKIHKKILNFCPIVSHRGSQIGEMIEKCLLDWGIDKILTITVDNARSNDTVVGYMKTRITQWGTDVLKGKHLHMWCISHIINLVVTDGLKEGSVSIDKVRAAVKFVRNSPSRLAKFKSCIEFEKIQSKCSLCLDVCTRWNSTYLMLSSALKFKRAFVRFESEDPNFKFELESTHGVPKEEDWKKVEMFVTFLKSFYELTLRISGSLYVTSNTFFHEIIAIDCQLLEWIQSTNTDFASMTKNMKLKYDKYWGDIGKMNMLIYVSVVLDPLHKLQYVDFVFSELQSKDGKLVEETRDEYDEDDSNDESNDETSDEHENRMTRKVKAATVELFKAYRKKFKPKSSEKSQGINKDIMQEALSCDMKERYKKFKSSSSSGVQGKSELQKYLKEECEDDTTDFCILTWWKVNSNRFPVLSQMARDILAVPISTVASESSFSTGGRVLDSFRISLSPKMVQSLLCSQDWIRKSHNRLNIEEDILDVDKLDEELSKMVGDLSILDM